MEVAVAAVTIIGQLETIYMIIDKIVQYQQMVCRYKDTCRDFVNFVKEIETVLRNKASNLKLDQERKFSNDVKRQLDNLEEHLRCAAALLSDLESPLRIAAYTGVAANKISELRGQLMEAVTLLTFHIVCSPSEKQALLNLLLPGFTGTSMLLAIANSIVFTPLLSVRKAFPSFLQLLHLFMPNATHISSLIPIFWISTMLWNSTMLKMVLKSPQVLMLIPILRLGVPLPVLEAVLKWVPPVILTVTTLEVPLTIINLSF
ncbi:hypothetical protein AXG93_1862s1010 [Marchantia polymorpha subsp. ruderalis]|uniref:Uncharacterized protein n=1 Tax=Marchantia polymorpha subsp. ruderalis TaxID=1480154 RepID=A0A176W817_MARPO|nr:hypothetical protein AXG93_1862s1010 [Marchantia polymorpha subsp. ruderalis]